MPSAMRLLTALLLVLTAAACSGPTYERASDNPSIDEGALSTRLDRVDLDLAMEQWYADFTVSRFATEPPPAGKRSLSVLDISNDTSEHIGSALRNLINSVETNLVNDGTFDVISNDQIAIDAISSEHLRGDAVDPETMARLGKELGVHYFIHGRVGETAEKTDDRRRVQYYLFLKVTEVETRRNVFQKQIDITKQVSG